MSYKRIVIRSLLIICCIFTVIHLIGMHPERAGWPLLLLYIIIPLATLSLNKHNEQVMWIGGSILALGLIGVGKGEQLAFWAAGLFIFGIMITLNQHKQLLETKKHISNRAVASGHSLIFSIVLAITGTLSLMARQSAFAVTCDQVYTAISSNINRMLLPLRLTSDEISNLTNTVNTFFTKSADQVVEDQVANNINKKLNNIGTAASENPQVQSFMSSLKQIFIDTPLESKHDIDDKICNVVFSQIREWYKNPSFKLSVFITLVLFFYPLIRFFVFILSCIFSFVYHALRKAKFIKIVPEQVVMEKWEI